MERRTDPVTTDPLTEPFIASDGYTYNLQTLRRWATRCSTNEPGMLRSPVTNEPLRRWVYPHPQAAPSDSCGGSAGSRNSSLRPVALYPATPPPTARTWRLHVPLDDLADDFAAVWLRDWADPFQCRLQLPLTATWTAAAPPAVADAQGWDARLGRAFSNVPLPAGTHLLQAYVDVNARPHGSPVWRRMEDLYVESTRTVSSRVDLGA